jgi:hypothetical protein
MIEIQKNLIFHPLITGLILKFSGCNWEAKENIGVGLERAHQV